ncbi:GNAT family N-acetyltransferase [Sphingomonas abietis]|uniref:GNAT family N-acetyltransferase n=1 Tax=Sphingomonas abietis TaxID=3012344 RepID=A0ABY7NKS5_9SPHN|nr:GNAT family N-acetyltransferase [Sphingomonas abietis]WBO21575.1 GNAT family N-acetyltransferase [Sphingomonas abietis]
MRTAPEAPPPVPKLTIRQARASDAEAVGRLLSTVGFEGDASGARKAIASANARKEPILVAERADVIGILAWTVIADVLAGAVGRISVVVVDEHDRRDGVGKALYEAVVEEFGKRKVGLIEGMSDIEIRNANGFLRALGLRQVSYRFVARI